MGENVSASSSIESTEYLSSIDVEMGENVSGISSSESTGYLSPIDVELECCIYRVPRNLRKINEEAYTPQLVSIGPLHHGKEEHLIEMEKQKERYVEKFVERTGARKLMEFKSFIEDNESGIRFCYAEDPNLEKIKFLKMILHDAVFIIELFLRDGEIFFREFDILLHTPFRRNALDRDLQLLENQLLYFVLKELFSKLNREDFLILASRFFYGSTLDHRTKTHNIRHFTDLRRRFLLKEFNPPNPGEYVRDLPCEMKLDRSGVKFKKSVGEGSSLEIKCENIEHPSQIIFCNKVNELELKIPQFEIFDKTECLIRNVMAFEQLQYPYETHVCNYILLMDFLIDTEKDVDLLVEKGIIANFIGDNATVATMFNKFGLQVTICSSCYSNVAEILKKHYENRWNHTKATLKNVYFGDPWRGTGTVAATVLLVLTLVQTVCSILQVL